MAANILQTDPCMSVSVQSLESPLRDSFGPDEPSSNRAVEPWYPFRYQWPHAPSETLREALAGSGVEHQEQLLHGELARPIAASARRALRRKLRNDG